jgi:hypothetical protein
VRNSYAINNDKLEKESKMFRYLDFKQKQIVSLGNNSGYQTHRKNYYESYLKRRNDHTTDFKEYYDIISQEREYDEFFSYM